MEDPGEEMDGLTETSDRAKEEEVVEGVVVVEEEIEVEVVWDPYQTGLK